ncbi:MAG: hypothetical protein ABW061_23350 [Polyangiaceae bacterium]
MRSAWLGSPAQRVVEVQFWKPGDCFVVPEGTHVVLNGEALQLVSAGGRRPDTSHLRRPDAIRGIEIAAPNCEPALFRSQPFAPAPARSDRIVVEMSGHSGAVEIEGLLAERTLRVVSGPVERGKPVTLEWAPRSDVWPSRIVGAEVQIADADQKTILVAGSALKMKPGLFQFQLPDVKSNRVALSVNRGATQPYARVKRCSGFRECQSRAVMGPMPLEVEVVGTGSSNPG